MKWDILFSLVNTVFITLGLYWLATDDSWLLLDCILITLNIAGLIANIINIHHSLTNPSTTIQTEGKPK